MSSFTAWPSRSFPSAFGTARHSTFHSRFAIHGRTLILPTKVRQVFCRPLMALGAWQPLDRPPQHDPQGKFAGCVHSIDVLDCPTCHTRMEVISAIEDEHVAARILRHLGLPTTAPPRGKPWSRQRALALDRRADQSADPPSAFE